MIYSYHYSFITTCIYLYIYFYKWSLYINIILYCCQTLIYFMFSNVFSQFLKSICDVDKFFRSHLFENNFIFLYVLDSFSGYTILGWHCFSTFTIWISYTTVFCLERVLRNPLIDLWSLFSCSGLIFYFNLIIVSQCKLLCYFLIH